MSNGEPIIIYMHGNSGTRANDQRIELYRKLRDINCHVIAMDYRSTVLYYSVVVVVAVFSYLFFIFSPLKPGLFFLQGYADSTDVEIDETGLVLDAKEMFKWVYKRANGTPIFGWGHSLGTG